MRRIWRFVVDLLDGIFASILYGGQGGLTYTTSDLERGDLRLAGIEVLVARNWVKEEFWPRIQDAVQKGYAAEKTYTFLRAHADRRRARRPKKSS